MKFPSFPPVIVIPHTAEMKLPVHEKWMTHTHDTSFKFSIVKHPEEN